MSVDLWDAVMERVNLIERLAKFFDDKITYTQLYIASSWMTDTELRKLVEFMEQKR